MRTLWLLLFIPAVALADPPDPREGQYHIYSRDEMYNITAEAAQKRPDVALLLKNFENIFWKNMKHVGLDQNIVVPIASVAAPLIAHKISTRSIHIDWKPAKNLTVRPDVDYYFMTGEQRYALTFTWRF